MIESLLIVVFSLISIAGVIALLKGKVETMNHFRKVSLSFFTVSHLGFLVLGIMTFFTDLSAIWLITASILIITSRILNGLALYGKNNWLHYIVTSTILLTIITLHVWSH